MNIANLKYFYDVATLRSMIAAAKKNHVSQPAISQGIKKLEMELDLVLLKHKRNSIELTKEGELVIKKAKPLFDAISTFENDVLKIKSKAKKKIVIGISNSLIPIILNPILDKKGMEFSDLEIDIKLVKTNDQIDLLEKGLIDFGITIDNELLENYSKKCLKKGYFILKGKEQCAKRLLITEKRPETVMLKNILPENKFNQEMIIESWGSIESLVRSSYGIGLLPDFLANDKEFIDYNKKWKIKKSAYKIVLFSKEHSKESLEENVVKFISTLKF